MGEIGGRGGGGGGKPGWGGEEGGGNARSGRWCYWVSRLGKGSNRKGVGAGGGDGETSGNARFVDLVLGNPIFHTPPKRPTPKNPPKSNPSSPTPLLTHPAPHPFPPPPVPAPPPPPPPSHAATCIHLHMAAQTTHPIYLHTRPRVPPNRHGYPTAPVPPKQGAFAITASPTEHTCRYRSPCVIRLDDHSARYPRMRSWGWDGVGRRHGVRGAGRGVGRCSGVDGGGWAAWACVDAEIGGSAVGKGWWRVGICRGGELDMVGLMGASATASTRRGQHLCIGDGEAGARCGGRMSYITIPRIYQKPQIWSRQQNLPEPQHHSGCPQNAART